MGHTLKITVYYEDTDSGGIVYYANYLRFMERGRTEFLAARGISLKTCMDQGTLFTVSRAEIDYRSYARYGDTIIMETTISEVTAASIVFQHTMKERESGRLIAEGMIRLVCVNSSGRPKRIPKEITTHLSNEREV